MKNKQHLNQFMYELFWIFFIGCFLGVVIESIWCLVTRGYYESRSGLIYGPFNLVYGFGVLLMTIGIVPIKHQSNPIIFFFGFIIGTIFEYCCSYLQQQWFGTISWDYTHLPFSFNGRVNLIYSCFWGLLTLGWIKYIYPWVVYQIKKIPKKIGKILTCFLLLFMIFNTTISALALERQSERRQDAFPTTQLDILLDTYYPDERLSKVYPNMIITDE